ncbi:MAG: hypothetical protein M1831_006919 [Alyxoria varia]|nr:MAG: hypothetical protein M1831_006919 [Alyxoria varia]
MTLLPRVTLKCHVLRTIGRRRPFTTCNSRSSPYDDTISNLKIGSDTRVIYQGFTGRVSTTNAQQSLEYGTKVVGGTTPSKEGEHLGLPLLPSVQKAAEQLKPHASAVFVAAHQAGGAIEDAIAAEIPLIIAVAEFIPLHNMLRICSILKTQSKSRLVGANTPGIIAPLGNCRIGFQPLPCYMPGYVGLAAKSGTLSYETVGGLTRAGIGQSLCIGIGGDIVTGTDLVDALKLFESDADTEAIVLVGEVGGKSEQDAADWIKEYNKRVSKPKPIVALVAGLEAPPGRIMGHAGAFASMGEVPAATKHKALNDAGVTMVSHPSKFAPVLKNLMSGSGRDPNILPSRVFLRARTFPYDYEKGPDQATMKDVFEHLHLDAAPPAAMATCGRLIETLTILFKEREAYGLSTHVSGTQDGNLQIEWASFDVDDSAYKSKGRQQDLFALRNTAAMDADEVEAETDGLVYVKLNEDQNAKIGTLINGAGLAMNALDCMTLFGARPTNFMDTGGKATSATIKKSFELLLRDSRVECIFVNIFGGLTLCDMIAEGIMLAFKDLRMTVPVVVRLRGTNEEKGQRMIAQSGLPLHAFDDFEEAAMKCIELADAQ